MNTEDKTTQIRSLNDKLRHTHTGGQVVITSGIQALGEEVIARTLKAVAEFDGFNGGNDPYKEHDCAIPTVEDQRVIFKVDYFDPTMQYYLENPVNPIKTRRVFTILLAEEY